MTVFIRLFIYGQYDVELAHHLLLRRRSLMFEVVALYSFIFGTAELNLRMTQNTNANFCFDPRVAYFNNGEVHIADFNFVICYIFEAIVRGVYPLVEDNCAPETQTNIQAMETLTQPGKVVSLAARSYVVSFTFLKAYSEAERAIADRFINEVLLYPLN